MNNETQQLQAAAAGVGAAAPSCGDSCGSCGNASTEKGCGDAPRTTSGAAAAAAPVFDADKERTMLFVIYGLFLGGLVTGGLTAIVAAIMLHVRKSEVAASAWMTSHYDWGIKTFWYGLLGGFVSLVLSFVGIGVILMIAVSIWWLYRVVRGLLGAVDKKTLPASLI